MSTTLQLDGKRSVTRFKAYFSPCQAHTAAQASLRGSRTELNAAETSVVGALAGAVTGVLTTPLDVIKTRMMTQGVSGRYSSIVDCATKIAKEEGAAAFLKVRF